MKSISLILLLQLIFAAPGFASNLDVGHRSSAAETEFFDPFDARIAADIADPLEAANRMAFWLNDKVYGYVLKPVCLAIPVQARENLGRWLKNLGEPLNLGRVSLEFKFRDAGSEVGRFVLHGLLQAIDRFDPARTAVLTGGDEDFNEVLKAFGVGPGIYLILPVFGPSSLREGIGQIASLYLDPLPCFLKAGRSDAGRQWSLLAELQTYESIRNATLDPYLSIRDAYTQQQASTSRKEYVSRATGNNRYVAAPPRSHFLPTATY